jgi:prophage antirepressor-like protein
MLHTATTDKALSPAGRCRYPSQKVSMSNLALFAFESNEVRIVMVDGDPWFVAKDVCAVLEHSDVSMACRRLDDDEKGTSLIGTPGGTQTMTTINESGLYSLIMTSRKPEAKRFKKWVNSEVLPSIRKTGSYSLPAVASQPKLPAEVKAVNISKAIVQIESDLSHQPRLMQFLIDHAISDIIPAGKSLSGSRLRGVAEIAIDLGYQVSDKNRSQLGKFVKKFCSEFAQMEERLCNGTMREIACYPEDHPEVVQAIHKFFG